MDYQLRRSSRKSIAIQILPDGKVLVRCPQRMPAWQIDAFVKSKRPWIEKHLPTAPALPPFTPEELKDLARQAGERIAARAEHFAPLVGVTYQRITIRAQHTRWGSCSSKGNLNFNCLLALVPDAVLDYVVVHELCHRLELNHSARFWAQVERILPHYRQSRTWLKQNAQALLSRLPR